MVSKSRVTILVKASPQPSEKHNETVCCAGIDDTGQWKRLFPIRFRQLSGGNAFSRWDVVDFSYRKPTSDNRFESCRVHEESISVTSKVTSKSEKSSIVERALLDSEKEAVSRGSSLAVIRPTKVNLTWRRRDKSEIEKATTAFAQKAAQLSMFDKELAAYTPCPFEFKMKYFDGGGPHNKECADWETAAAFFNLSKRYEEREVLKHLQKTYTEDYVEKGLVFALGNMKKRPQTWQLLGIFPVEDLGQQNLLI